MYTRFLMALAMIAVPILADVVFSDTTFSNGTYTGTTYSSDPAATVSFGQCASCGNPGQAMQILINEPNSFDIIALGLNNSSFSYDPLTQGAIQSINASVDKNVIFNQDVSGGNAFHPMLEQDGAFYIATILGPALVNNTTTGYNTISQTGLLATDFTKYDFTTGTLGPAHPNFAGDPITFGLAQLSSLGFPVQLQVDYDNLNLDVVTTPEPSYLLVLATALFGLMIRRKQTEPRP